MNDHDRAVQEFERRLEGMERQLAAITAERDQLQASLAKAHEALYREHMIFRVESKPSLTD